MKTLGLRAFTAFFATFTALTALICTWAPWARADQVAYLINVTVRPGYNFANADAALNYGRGICEKITQGLPYGRVMSDIKADFGTADEYQASYLISQSANELCPALIWQLRNSAAGYRPPVG
jgi:hypothetical protein